MLDRLARQEQPFGDLGLESPSPSSPDAVGLGSTIWVSCGQLGGDVVLVGEPAENLLPADPVFGEVDRFWLTSAGLSWGELAASGAAGRCCNAAGTRSGLGAGGAH
jgi:hypothetical protein